MSAALRRLVPALLLAGIAGTAHAEDALQVSGFALLRGASAPDSGPLVSEELSAQVQLGIDWRPTPMAGAHLHLLGRSNGDDTRRGTFGIVEAYADINFVPNGDRLRLRGGAFFLPTSRENVDALWEPAYTITPSALNSWLGEELRPIGIDAVYFRGRVSAGATIFRGNDTFGAIPPARGWRLDDHWTLLGEWVPVEDDDFTSVSAENDGRLGWAARGAWNGQRLFLQYTYIDNRSDGLPYGPLFNWGTRFDIAAVEFTHEDWTFAGEYGWGPTFLVVEENTFTTELVAAYALASRFWPQGIATLRADWFHTDDIRERALTLALLWTPPGKLRPGIELSTSEGEQRVLVELRYSF